MRLEILTKNTGWYGSHSGYYERLPEHVAQLHAETRITRPVNRFWARAAGKLIALGRGLPPRNQTLTFAEELFAKRYDSARSVAHVMSFEDNAPLLSRWSEAPRSLVATIHYPPEMFDASLTTAARRLRSAIVLYQRDVEYFESLIGKGRVRLALHGVDLDFFHPAPTGILSSPPRLAYVGQFGRNAPMFARVAGRLLEAHKDLELDVVIANRVFLPEALKPLAAQPRVTFHHGISDEELRAVYHRATALLLPMNASGANNAIVEAIACGVPIATTDVGGIRDYGGGSLFPLAPNNDDDALIDIATQYLTDSSRRSHIAQELRRFAVQNLRWESSAQSHLRACWELAGAV